MKYNRLNQGLLFLRVTCSSLFFTHGYSKFLKIINGATGKNNTTEVKLDKFVISEKFNSGFALDLMVKDVSIANSLIKDLSSEKPLSNDVLFHLSEALRTLEGNPDHTEVYKAIKK